MGININQKGKIGEREVINLLQPFFPEELTRNLLQTREGGADVSGCWPFVIEVKRVQDTCNGNKNSWWRQVRKAVINYEEEIPCVIFRPNKAAWRVLISVEMIGLEGEGWMEMNIDDFLRLVIKTYDELGTVLKD